MGKHYIRCPVCGHKFHREGTRAIVCPDCRPIHYKGLQDKFRQAHRGIIDTFVRKKCFFHDLGCCSGPLKVTRRDLQSLSDAHGCHTIDNFTKGQLIQAVEDPDQFITLCAKHMGMWIQYFVNNPTHGFDHAFLHVIDSGKEVVQ